MEKQKNKTKMHTEKVIKRSKSEPTIIPSWMNMLSKEKKNIKPVNSSMLNKNTKWIIVYIQLSRKLNLHRFFFIRIYMQLIMLRIDAVGIICNSNTTIDLDTFHHTYIDIETHMPARAHTHTYTHIRARARSRSLSLFLTLTLDLSIYLLLTLFWHLH